MDLRTRASSRLERIAATTGLKPMRATAGPVGATIRLAGAGEVAMFAANDYLGLAGHPEVAAAAMAALRKFGAGSAGARFICGTTELHTEFEAELAAFLGMEAAITVSSGFAANIGLIATLAEPGDVIFSDALNHASLIDGGRMAPGARKVIYPHSDLAALEAGLAAAEEPGQKFIVTDGVFSMEGDLARLDMLAELAARYRASLIVDDAHGIGVLGTSGAGTAEHFGVAADIVTGSLGKALGGVAGGFVAGPRPVIDLLNQAARPQLFSTALPATSIAASRAALAVLRGNPGMITVLAAKAARFRGALEREGVAPLAGITPIVPLVLGDATRTRAVSERLLEQGIYCVALAFPTVPVGEARIRFQISSRHDDLALDLAAAAVALACRDVPADALGIDE